MQLKEPIDIVIPLKSGSDFRNLELKFSLRSIEKYLLNYRNIYVLSSNFPPFLNQDKVFCIKYDDLGNNKEQRIMNKFLFACSIPELSETFIASNDDYFLIKPIDALAIP